MENKDKLFFIDSAKTDCLNVINQNPEIQLVVIKHFFPQVTSGKKFRIHKEKNASSSLKLDKGKYWLKNFGAGNKAMDWLNITEQQLGCDTPEALKYALDNIVGDMILPKRNTLVNRTFSGFEKRIYAIENNSKKDAEAYLLSRKIDLKKLPSLSFFQSNNSDGVSSIAFFDSEKKLINERKLISEKGCYKNTGQLYNSFYNALYKPNESLVFLVEGCINSLSIAEQSSLAFFSADNNFSDHKKLSPYIKGKSVVLAFDGDEAGEKISQKMLSLICDYELTEMPILRLLLPAEKDLNDLLCNGELNAFLENPESYSQLHPKLLKNSDDEAADFEDKGYFKRNHCYWVQSTIKGRKVERCISNFIMDVLYFFPDGTDDASRIYYLQNKSGKTEMVSISSKALKLPDFKAAIRSKGNFSFRGTVEDIDRILEDICHEEREAKEISILGFQPKFDFFAYSNGVLTRQEFHKVNKYGVVELLQGDFYLPAFSKVNSHSLDYMQEKKIYYREGKLTFKEWNALFKDAYGEMGMVGTIFTLAALMRDIIFEELEFFPYLFLFGDAGVGKTSFSEILLNLLYKNYKGISLEGQSSAKAIARNVHKFRNGLIYLKEFENSLNKGIIGMLKTGYEGVGYSRAQTTNDNKTHDTFFNSAIILDGNCLPAETSALLSRMIVLDFRKNTFTDLQTNAYKRLRQESENGFGKVVSEILSKREHFRIQFKENIRSVENQLKSDIEYQVISERSIKHFSLFLGVYKSLYQKLEFAFSYNELFTCLGNIIAGQDREIAGLSRVNRFWNELDFLNSDGQIRKGIHYTYATRHDGKEFIALKLDLLHRLYLKNASSHDGEIARKNDLLRLIQNDSAFMPSWMKGRNNSITVKGFGSAYAFDPEKIDLNIHLWQN